MLDLGYLWLNGTRVWGSSPCAIKTYLLAEGVLYFTLSLCVYYKTTILNSKPRWNISALSGLIPSMRAIGARKHTSQGGMSLPVHAWWNPFIRLSVTVSVSMLAYLMLPIKLSGISWKALWREEEWQTKVSSSSSTGHFAMCDGWPLVGAEWTTKGDGFDYPSHASKARRQSTGIGGSKATLWGSPGWDWWVVKSWWIT